MTCSLRFTSLLLTLVAALGCDESPGRVLLDLEGPQGQAEAPGPWTIAILTDGTEPTLLVSVDESGFDPISLSAVGHGQYVGSVAPLPVGAVFEYAAKAGGESLPSGPPRAVQVVAPTGPVPDASVGRCRLTFRSPVEGQRLDIETDDGAPQAGLQVAVILDTDLPDGHPVRLEVGETTYADVVGAGQVGFREVTLPLGETRLRVHGRRVEGECVQEISVFVSG